MVKTQNIIEMFIELLTDPNAIIRRLPLDVQNSLSKRGTLRAWAEDGSIETGPNVYLASKPAPRKRANRIRTKKPNVMDSMIWAIKQVPASELTLHNLIKATSYSPHSVVETMRKLGYKSTLTTDPKLKLFTIIDNDARGTKYTEIYDFLVRHLPEMKTPIDRKDVLSNARLHKIIANEKHERDLVGKAIRSMAMDDKLVLSNDKKSIIAVNLTQKGE